MRYTVDPTFGARLREYRDRADMSLRDLARVALSSKTHLHEFEAGTKTPSPETAQRLDEALGARGELAALVIPDDNASVHRRTLVGLAAGIVAGLPVLSPYLSAGSSIGADTVAAMARRTARLRRLDDYLGGADTYPRYVAEVNTTMGVLDSAAYTEPIRRGLSGLLAEQAQMAAFAAFDAGWRPEARRLVELSIPAARQAGDTGLSGNALALLGYQSAPGQAVELLDQAVTEGANAAPRVRALLAERAAWAHSVAGDPVGVAVALDRAEKALDDVGGRNGPDWAFWVDRIELQIMAGRCWTALHRPLRAIAALEAALADYDDTHGRDKALYLTYLATAYVQAGEVEQACALVDYAMTLSAGLASVRPRQYVADVLAQLGAYRDVPRVAEVVARSVDWTRQAPTLSAAPTRSIEATPPTT